MNISVTTLNPFAAKPATAVILGWAGALAACVYFLIGWWTPLVHDDLNFLDMFLRANDGEQALSPDSWVKYLQMVRLENDGRFSNYLEILFQFMPRGVFCAVMALAGGLWVSGSALAACGRQRLTFFLTGTTWALIILFLPWQDDILGCMNFELNYVVSSGVEVIMLLMLLCGDRLRYASRVSFCLITFYAFIAGGFHEGFSLPMVSGYAAWCLLRRRWPGWRMIVVLGVMCVAIFADVSSAGMMTRIGGVGESEGVGLYRIVRYLTLPLLLFCATVIAACFSGGRRLLGRLMRSPRVSLLCVIAGCAALMSLALGADGRVCWAADWYAVLLTVSILAEMPEMQRKRKAAIALWLLLAAFYANVIYWQRVYYTETLTVLALYEASEDGEVDYYWAPAAPASTLHHVCRWNMYSPGPLRFLQTLDPGHRLLKVRLTPDSTDRR